MAAGKVKRVVGFTALSAIALLFFVLASVIAVNAENSSMNPSSAVRLCFETIGGGEAKVFMKWGSLSNNTKVKVAPGAVACVMLRAPLANIRRPILITVKDSKDNTLLVIDATPSIVGYVLSKLEMNSDKIFLPENFLRIKELITYVVPTITVRVSDPKIKLSKNNVEVLVDGIRASNINVTDKGNGTYTIVLHDKVIVDPGTVVKVSLRLRGVGDVISLIKLNGNLTSNESPRIQASLVTNGTALSLAKVMLQHYVTLQEFDIKAPLTQFSGGTVKALAKYEVLAGASPGSGTYVLTPSNTTTTSVTESTTKATSPLPKLRFNLSSDSIERIVRALLPSVVLLFAGALMRSRKVLAMAAILAAMGLVLELTGW